MKRVGVVVHVGRPAAVTAAGDLVRWLKSEGTGTRQLDAEPVGAEETAAEATFAPGLDLIVSFGGDGTLLRAARLASGDGCPVLGVKVGRLGFLTEIDPDDAPACVAEVLDDRARIEERMAVVARVEGAPWTDPQWGLNEVIVEKHIRHRLVRLAVYVDREYLTTFSADGVIVATPTGSTAYSFAAGGPILTPTLRGLVITPIAAHMVFDRSLVLGPEQHVTLEVVGDETGVLSADGREALEIPVGARVHIAAAERPARLVHRVGGPGFLTLVRDKFRLPGDVGGSA